MEVTRSNDLIEVLEQLQEEVVGGIAEVDSRGCVSVVD